jgi:hypothetical protein
MVGQQKASNTNKWDIPGSSSLLVSVTSQQGIQPPGHLIPPPVMDPILFYIVSVFST